LNISKASLFKPCKNWELMLGSVPVAGNIPGSLGETTNMVYHLMEETLIVGLSKWVSTTFRFLIHKAPSNPSVLY